MLKRRWSDKNFNLWPLTFSWDTYPKLGVMLDSGHDESRGCHIRLYLHRLCLLVELPPIVTPYRIKHIAGWDAATIARLGRDYYFEEHAREYGFSYSYEGAIHVHYGPQTHSSDTTRSDVWSLPWANWRFVRMSYYDLSGKHWWTEPKGMPWEERHAKEAECPSTSFEFLDFDGERIQATTHIEEREWLFGTGRFKWLSLFRKPLIRRSLDIEFSKETGKRKGSWKGGTIGTGIDMLPGELHESAFRRYCAEHNMKFIGAASSEGESVER
jgi:hypothetical protein